MYQKVTLIGKVGKEPTIREVGKDKTTLVGNLSVCTWHSVQNKQTNQWEQITEWHNVVVWGNATKAIEKLQKGDYVLVDGEIKTREWMSKDGVTQKMKDIVGIVKGIHPPQKYNSTYQYSAETKTEKPTWTPDTAASDFDDLPI